jgi:acetolactate synthase-1/2/3 large subunit
MVRQWQQLFFDKRYASTEMTNPILSLLQSYYIKAKKGNQKRRFRCCRRNDGFKRFLFTEVMVEKENNVFPMIPTGALSEIRLS